MKISECKKERKKERKENQRILSSNTLTKKDHKKQ